MFMIMKIQRMTPIALLTEVIGVHRMYNDMVGTLGMVEQASREPVNGYEGLATEP